MKNIMALERVTKDMRGMSVEHLKAALEIASALLLERVGLPETYAELSGVTSHLLNLDVYEILKRQERQ